MTARVKNTYFHPRFCVATSQGGRSVAPAGFSGHELEGRITTATRAATTAPKAKKMERKVRR